MQPIADLSDVLNSDGEDRLEFRYPLAGAGLALAAVALHEGVGFGLQSPLNRYLLAVWVGLVWGIGGGRGGAVPGEGET
jgi:hypothetical protein